MSENVPGPEGQTRQRILSLLLDHGSLNASSISQELGLSAAGVRRHMDNLLTDGLVEEAPSNHSSHRGRGRPARAFRLTDQGRGSFGYDYDTLAVLALEALKESGGPEAVTEFAHKRMAEIIDDAKVENPDCSVEEIADKLAQALTKHGYAATVSHAGGGIQICRHHCPIQGVAEHFPEMCAAEHEAVRSALGQHTQPLATIVDGNGLCTTHIPHHAVTKERN